MALYLIVFAAIIFICVFLNKVSSKAGIPVLLMFIILGMIFGRGTMLTGLEAQPLENLCTIALIFIMFYGGFGTRWSSARPVVVEAGLLATLGVALTAGLVGLFCHFILHWGWVESFLMGSVISSTDAATVFSILRARKLGLKNNTAPLLEIESGSNDPCSYMLTAVMLSILNGSASGGHVVWMIFAQFLFGAAGGLVIAKGAVFVLKHHHFQNTGFKSLFILAAAVLAYAVPTLIGGNGFLSAYIVGIIMGNTEFQGRKPLVAFFDGVTSLMQIVIFFMLGLAASPTALVKALVPSLIIFACLTFLARPISVGLVLLPFRKYPLRQRALISFVGLRGAASIVFAIMTITHGAALEHDIFSVVFCIVLISISLQGTLIPWIATRLKMIDTSNDVMTTFTDFSEEAEISFGRIDIKEDSPWNGKILKEIVLPGEMLITLLIRGDERIVPRGHTMLQAGDRVIFCSKTYKNETEANLRQHTVSKNSRWAGQPIKAYPNKTALVVMIKRGGQHIIPDGDTILQSGDVLVILDKME